MSLVALPDELLGHICTFLGLEEIKNLRLTRQSIRDVANEHLLPEIVLFQTVRSIDTAACLAINRPELTKGVRSLRFRAERLSEFVDFNVWNVLTENDETHPSSPPVPVHVYTEAIQQSMRSVAFDLAAKSGYGKVQLDHVDPCQSPNEAETPYTQWKQLRLEQQLLDSKGPGSVLWTSLSTLFRGCPHLNYVHFTMSRSSKTQSQCTQQFRRNLLNLTGTPLPLDGGVHALTQVLQAAHDTGRKLHALVVEGVSSLFFSQAAALMHDIHSIAKGLEVFRWRFADRGYHNTYEGKEKLRLGSLRRFFRQAKNLKVLDLDLSGSRDMDYYFMRRTLAFSDLIGEIIFPQLEEVRLTDIMVASIGGI